MLNKLMMTTAAAALALSVTANAQEAQSTEQLNQEQGAMIEDAQHAEDTMLHDSDAVANAKKLYKEAMEEEIGEMNEVASILIDAEELYSDASKLPDSDTPVREHLMELSKERAQQREEIQQFVASKGAEADTYGEALGTGHRAFTQMRTAFENDKVVAVEEVLRGEKYIVDQINERIDSKEIASEDAVTLLKDIRAEVEASIAELETQQS